MVKLKKLTAYQVLDSNGNLTLKVKAVAGSYEASAIVPSGSSRGIHESKVISAEAAVKRVNLLNKDLKNKKLSLIDSLISDEPGNVSTGISIAVNRLIAKSKGKEYYELLKGKTLPVPFMNVINGGLHAGNELAFQEFMIAPLGNTFKESLMMGARVYRELREYLENNYGRESINVGMEGGFAPPMKNVEEPLKVLRKVLFNLNLEKKVSLAIDAAASQFFNKDKYDVNDEKLSPDELIKYYEKLASEYNIVSIEDPFHEDDFESFARLRRVLKKSWVVGDDLLVSDPSRVRRAVNENSCNCLLLKVNQVGTVKRALESVNIAKKHDWKVMVSHRSGDSCDSFIADVAVGVNAGMIKSGAPARGERVAKYNRLLEIEEKLGSKALYPSTL
ncbi:phosphopyruvate hydratase [archaeon]|nr:phosphopyruvate hydratase [archaeon]